MPKNAPKLRVNVSATLQKKTEVFTINALISTAGRSVDVVTVRAVEFYGIQTR